MTFTHTDTLNRLAGTFGKWSWIADGKLNFVKWDPTVADTKKTTTQLTLTGTHTFKAASSEYDCIVTEVGTT